MGARSTMDITKEDAMKEIMAKLFNATNSELEDIMLSLYRDDKLYNYKIVAEYKDEDDLGYYGQQYNKLYF